MGKNFLLVSLEDEKAKQVASALSSSSCRKILDYLAEKEASETQISKDLNIPISTVHYNLEILKDAGLVDWDKYHYSEKGKEVRHYKLVNKYIIIAPRQNDSSFLEKLKGFMPTFLLSIVASGLIFFSTYFGRGEEEFMAMARSESSDMMLMSVQSDMMGVSYNSFSLSQIFLEPAIWFLFGSLFAILVYIAFKEIRRK